MTRDIRAEKPGFLFPVDRGVLHQVEGLDALRRPILEKLEVLECQPVDESVAAENPDRDLDVDDADAVLEGRGLRLRLLRVAKG